MASMAASNMLTRGDLDALPDDGLRHELIDGQFVMTPAPGFDHQMIAGSVHAALRNATRGTALTALSAPFDVVLGPHVVEPDVLVARRRDFTARDLPVAPLLVVEVLSPSTRHLDTGRKRDVYAEAGVRHYWLIDPEGPSIMILELADGRYAEVGRVRGEGTLDVEHPVELTLCPAELLAD